MAVGTSLWPIKVDPGVRIEGQRVEMETVRRREIRERRTSWVLL